jgi:rare lipoprotein A
MRCRLATLAVVLATAGNAAPAAGDPSGGTLAPDGPATVAVRPAVLLGRVAIVSGTTASPDAPVAIQRLDGDRWETVAEASSSAEGAFTARWRADRVGHLVLRAVAGADASAARAAVAPTTQVTVYRPAAATWYGPGFYGRRTACGMRLGRDLLGVAHRSLPCGTLVDILYRGRTVTVPVIDRGPFARDAEWDLTAAAARLLGLRSSARIGALPHPWTATGGSDAI